MQPVARHRSVYLFTVNVCYHHQTSGREAGIAIGGNVVVRLVANWSLWSQISQTVLLSLAPNDEVSVLNIHSEQAFVHGFRYSSFSGIMLWAL